MPRLPFCLAGLLGLAACATPHDAQVSIPGTADAERALLKSMQDVDTAYSTVGGPPVAPRVAEAPPELTRSVKYRAAGTLDDVVHAIATGAGYRFTSNATSDTPRVSVKVETESSSLLDLLRSAGTQAGSKADVIVRVEDRMVEVRYHA